MKVLKKTLVYLLFCVTVNCNLPTVPESASISNSNLKLTAEFKIILPTKEGGGGGRFPSLGTTRSKERNEAVVDIDVTRSAVSMRS